MTKFCNHCTQDLPIESFAAATRQSVGVQSWCRTCHTEHKRRGRLGQPCPHPARVHRSTCARGHDTSAPESRDGRGWCRQCKRAQGQRRRQRIARAREQGKRLCRRGLHEKVEAGRCEPCRRASSTQAGRTKRAGRARQAAWAATKADPERLAETRRRNNETHRRRKAEDPDEYACRKAWYAANKAYGPGVSYEDWVPVWSGTCFDCGVAPAKGVDHIIGQTRAGTNDLDNLQPACLSCNARKARRDGSAVAA